MQRDESLLADMAYAVRLILQFTEPMTFDAFRADPKTQSAVIHRSLLSAKWQSSSPTTSGNPIPTSLGRLWPVCATS